MAKDALYVVANKVLATANVSETPYPKSSASVVTGSSSHNRSRTFGVWWGESLFPGKKLSASFRLWSIFD